MTPGGRSAGPVSRGTRWILAATVTILLGFASLITSFLPPRGSSVNFFGKIWASCLLRIWSVELKVEGVEPADTPRVIMANHKSLLDIPVLFRALPDRIAFMAKRQLFAIPFLGWAMSAAGFIPVDRVDRSKAAATIRLAKKRMGQGLSILVFPEETRTTPGKMLPFKKGGFILARMGGVPIYPVGLEGTADIMTRGNRFIRPGTVWVRGGESVSATRGIPIEETIDTVRHAVKHLSRTGE